MATKSPSNTGATLWDFASVMAQDPAVFDFADPTMEALTALTKVAQIFKELENKFPELTVVAGTQLVTPHLERAWRELLYLRSRVPGTVLASDIFRPYTVTRYGRIIPGDSPEAKAYRSTDQALRKSPERYGNSNDGA